MKHIALMLLTFLTVSALLLTSGCEDFQKALDKSGQDLAQMASEVQEKVGSITPSLLIPTTSITTIKPVPTTTTPTISPTREYPAANFVSIYDVYKDVFFEKLSVDQKSGLILFYTYLCNDTEMTDLHWMAYMLATVKHETAGTYRPITEYHPADENEYSYFENKYGGRQDLGNTQQGDGYKYRGRGYVQLTGRTNYTTLGKILGINLVNDPDLALEPYTAYKIMSYGMLNGKFTGVGLSKYINGTNVDYYNARRIINGLDKANLIQEYANKFAQILDTNTNLIPNPSFEYGDSLPSNWYMNMVTATYFWDDTISKTGKYSVGITKMNEHSSGEWNLIEIIPTVKGTTYRLSGWIKGTSNLEVYIALYPLDQNGKWLCGESICVQNGEYVYESWTYFEKIITFNYDDAVNLIVVLGFNNPGPYNQCAVWFDDIALQIVR
jgi:putative chitinase